MDWRALIRQNQWFQLCALVAALSLGALGFDLAMGRFGGSHGSNPSPGPGPTVAPGPTMAPIPTAAPLPVFARLTPRTRGQWIVDASGASDADSRDLRAVAANVSDGDTVTIRAGGYEGGFEVVRNVRFIGQGNVVIRATNRDTVLVSGQQVSFEHLTIGFDGTGDQFCSLRVVRQGHVELNGCSIGSKAQFNALAFDTATLSARGTRFATAGLGCALKFFNGAHGKLEQCECVNNHWGVEVVNAAQAELVGCTLSKNGLANGNGNTVFVQGGQARLTASVCTFSNNTASLFASDSGTLILNGGTLRDNGVSGEAGNNNDGLLRVQTSAHATLNGCVLESNKQGLNAFSDGSLQLTQTRITGTGIQTDNNDIKWYSMAVYATDGGTTVSIASSTIANSASDAIMAFGGASLTMLDSTVTNAVGNGLTLGYPKCAASHADLTRSHFLGNHSDGVGVNSGDSVTAQDCEFSNNGNTGLEITDLNSQSRVVNAICRNNKETGLWTHDGAYISASGCTLEGNGRGAQAGIDAPGHGPASMELANCTVRGNLIFGIGACTQSKLTFQGGYLGGQRENVYKETGAVVQQFR